MFYGRKKELDFLQSTYEKQNGQFIILYGRRRVGKTETLNHFCENKRHIFYSCIECPDQQQLTLFSERILLKDNQTARYINHHKNWEALFENIADISDRQDEKLIVVIDEFPYMVKNNPSIPSILQNCWDHVLQNKNIMLILCGSAMSFIEKEILSEKNPLYGRATGILKMQEMGYSDAFLFLDGFSIQDKITAYSILGGIPYYLKQFDTTLSIEENIIQNILTPGCILYSEVEFILRQELRETGTYNTIIQAIALGNTKLNDIFQKTQIEKTKLSAYLRNLTELGIIWKEFSVDAKVKEQANTSRGLYRLTDNYFAFWYSFVFPSRSELESGDMEGIMKHTIQSELDRFASYAYERICWQYLRELNQREKLPFHFTKIGHWWDKTNEIDIMATDNKEANYLAGECKFKKSPVGINILNTLQEKAKEINGNFYWYLFSRSGFTKELIEHAKEEKVTLITLEHLETL